MYSAVVLLVTLAGVVEEWHGHSRPGSREKWYASRV